MPGLRVAEEQAAGDLAVGGHDRHREVAADRQVALRHAVVGRAVAVARVGEHVVEADDPLAVERRREDRPCCAASGSARTRCARRRRACRACTPRRRRRSRCRRRRRTAAGVSSRAASVASWTISCSSSRPGDRAADALQRLRALLLAQQPAAGLLGLEARGVLASQQLERLDRVRRHLRELDRRSPRRRRVNSPCLSQSSIMPEARAVAGDERRDQPRAGAARRWRRAGRRRGARRSRRARPAATISSTSSSVAAAVTARAASASERSGSLIARDRIDAACGSVAAGWR